MTLIYSAGSVTTKNADVPAFIALPTYATQSMGTAVLSFTRIAETGIQAAYMSGAYIIYKATADQNVYSTDGTTLLTLGVDTERSSSAVAVSWKTGVGRYGYRNGVSRFEAGAYDGAWGSSTITLAGPVLLHGLSLYSSALTAIQLQALSA